MLLLAYEVKESNKRQHKERRQERKYIPVREQQHLLSKHSQKYL